MPCVEEGWTALGSEVTRVLGKSGTRNEIDSIGSVIDRLRPHIAGEARHTMSVLDAGDGLQGVVSGRTRGRKLINRTVVWIDRSVTIGVGFVQVGQAHKLGTFAPHIAGFD